MPQQKMWLLRQVFRGVIVYKVMKKAPHRPKKGKKVGTVPTFSGHAATAKSIAAQLGVSEKTVRNAEKFAEALEALEEVSRWKAQLD